MNRGKLADLSKRAAERSGIVRERKKRAVAAAVAARKRELRSIAKRVARAELGPGAELPAGDGAYFTDAWAAKRAGVHRTTVDRWRRTGNWPPSLRRLAELEVWGQVDLIDAAFAGFALRGGALVTPDGHPYSPSELRAVHWRLAQLNALEAELVRLRIELRALKADRDALARELSALDRRIDVA